jgi:carbamoyltransferase
MGVVLGISAYYHDSAAAIVRDGGVVAAAQEERFSRKKADAGFPRGAVRYCLEAAGVKSVDGLDAIAFYDKPLLTFDRLVETYFAFAPRGFGSFLHAVPTWVEDKLLLRGRLVREVGEVVEGKVEPSKLRFDYHHHSHAASAFFPSPFQSAAVLVMDGVGEWATTTIGHGRDGRVDLLRELRFPHSIGLLYAAFTYYLGYKVNDGEYKVMGLAPYGEPRFVDRIREKLMDLREDGSLRLDMRYFGYCTGLTMTNRRFDEAMGHPRREPESPLEQVHMDMAASVQAVTEEAVLRLARTARALTGERYLCLAGGVALNCVANGKLVRAGVFDDVWIQPAAGDAGGALGAALAVAYADGKPRLAPGKRDGMQGAYLGPSYGRDEIKQALDARGARYEELPLEEAIDAAAEALAQEKIVGWFQGRMEFGPRSLGSRSILADARSPRMQSVLNLRIKYRESFRPFAPAVLRDQVAEYFELERDSPYMLLVAPVRVDRRRAMADDERAATGLARLRQVRSDIPAVTHVDYSARVQTVHEDTNPRFHELLKSFRGKTGYGVLVNTSFNIRDEPIVCSPDDAYRCFMGTEMDLLVLETFVLRKERQ